MKHRYFYIYKTTCLITNKYYIGMHSTPNLNDKYMGSGKILKRSIAKYGKENHHVSIIKFVNNKNELIELERELVNETAISDSLCMNLKIGGEGGFDYINKMELNIRPDYKHSPETLNKILSNRTLTDDGRRRLSESAKRNCKMVSRNKNLSKSLTGKIKTDNHKENISISVQKYYDDLKAAGEIITKNIGCKNASYGTCYVTFVEQQLSIRIKKDQLSEYLSNGWIKGRKIKW